MDDLLIGAHLLASRIGVKPSTLAKWRSTGKGPKTWIYLSATHVAYPLGAVNEWLAERIANPPRVGRPPKYPRNR